MPSFEVTLSLVVGKEVQQAKKIPMHASGGGTIAGRKALRTSSAALPARYLSIFSCAR